MSSKNGSVGMVALIAVLSVAVLLAGYKLVTEQRSSRGVSLNTTNNQQNIDPSSQQPNNDKIIGCEYFTENDARELFGDTWTLFMSEQPDMYPADIDKNNFKLQHCVYKDDTRVSDNGLDIYIIEGDARLTDASSYYENATKDLPEDRYTKESIPMRWDSSKATLHSLSGATWVYVSYGPSGSEQPDNNVPEVIKTVVEKLPVYTPDTAPN